jgi:hypothetical protein
MNISPNPTDREVNVKIDEKDFKKGEVLLHSTKGHLLKSKSVRTNNFTLNIESLPPGSFILTVISDDGRKSSQTLIKK